MSRYQLIDGSHKLHAAVEAMRQSDVLCVDTEFHRERTYFPEFALLQIYGGGRCWVIDPLGIADLSPVWDVLTDPGILKVFHAARQDIEIIVRACGRLPLPLFDTQIAAALLGHGQQIGFGNLVQRLVRKNLSKQESFSDWLQRPLDPRQLDYAADDVIWLMPCFQKLRDELKARGRLAWLEEEQALLCNPASYAEQDDLVFWRVKGSNRLKGAHLSALRELAKWREAEARRRNIPRRRILSDEALVDIARRKDLDPQTLGRIRGLSPSLLQHSGKAILRAWRQGIHSPPEHWPEAPARKPLAPGTELRCEMLDTLVRLKAESGSIAPSILADKAELSALASWGHQCKKEPPSLACLKGWRYELVGRDLLRLLRGEICLSIDARTGRPRISSTETMR